MRREYLPKAEKTTPEIAETMSRLAAGDMRAIVDLRAAAEGPVRAMVSRSFLANGIRVDRDRLDDIVGDAIVWIVDHADGWSPDFGAKPWTWADKKIINRAYLALGQFADDIDEIRDVADRSTGRADDADPIELLEQLGAEYLDVRLLLEALSTVANERDRRLWLALQVESANGNRSPAVTVAQDMGLRPENVRKIRQRVQERLLALAGSEPRFAGLFRLQPLAAA